MEILGLFLFLAMVTSASTAHALNPATRPPSSGCTELPCSVIRNCSSTGVACEPDDRECVAEAVDNHLEVKCEQRCDEGKVRLVYCPSDTGRSDSKVVWLLLALAFALAIGGSAVAWVVLRKKKA